MAGKMKKMYGIYINLNLTMAYNNYIGAMPKYIEFSTEL